MPAIALLKRSDVDLFRLQEGDWEEAAQRLCADHPFSVTLVLVAPCASGVSGVARRLEAYSVGKQWFQCELATAVNALTDEVIALGAPLHGAGRSPATGDAAATATASMPPVSELTAEALPDDCTSDDATSEDEEFWEHLEPCAGRDADKACDIRSALEASLGKDVAKRILRKTTPSTTTNREGQKTRMLRLGAQFLKLRRED